MHKRTIVLYILACLRLNISAYLQRGKNNITDYLAFAPDRTLSIASSPSNARNMEYHTAVLRRREQARIAYENSKHLRTMQQHKKGGRTNKKGDGCSCRFFRLGMGTKVLLV